MPHIINAVILISVLSVGNASTFAASRTLEALAEIGQAPKVFAYVDKKGRPLATLAVVLALGPLAIIGCYDGGKLFDWLFALTGLSSFFTWYSFISTRRSDDLGDRSVWHTFASGWPSKHKPAKGNYASKTSPTKQSSVLPDPGLGLSFASCALRLPSIVPSDRPLALWASCKRYLRCQLYSFAMLCGKSGRGLHISDCQKQI
jgi:Amino acid permease